jgi:hypothetical protein
LSGLDDGLEPLLCFFLAALSLRQRLAALGGGVGPADTCPIGRGAMRAVFDIGGSRTPTGTMVLSAIEPLGRGGAPDAQPLLDVEGAR